MRPPNTESGPPGLGLGGERTGQYARLITFGAVVCVIAGLYLARSVLIPFVLAILVSFLLAPLVLQLQRCRFSRTMAVATSVLLVFAASCAATWLVMGQVRDVTTKLSEYKENIQNKMAALRVVVDEPLKASKTIVEALDTDPAAVAEEPEPAALPIQTVRLARPVRGSLEVLRDSMGPTLDIVMTTAMALLFAFVMLLRRDDLGDRFIRIVGHGNVLVTTRALEEAAKNVSSYLWRLLLLNGLHGLTIGIGLAFIGIPNALLWGLLTALLRFIPYVGPWIAAAFPILTALAVSSDWSQPLQTVGLFVVLELISNNLLEPWFFGTGTGISPLALLVSTLFWTWIWGPVGLVLSTPLTVCLVVVGKYVPQLNFLHLLFGDAPGLSAPARLYQRLIAGDQDQAWLVLQTELKERALHEVYDSVVLPALSMAEHDRQRGALDERAEARIDETIRLILEDAVELPARPDADLTATEGPAAVGALRVLCLPVRGTIDALAAAMLRQVLERDGVEVQIGSMAELSGEAQDLLERRRVDIVCMSAMPPSRFMQVRYLCKRIANRLPEVPIVAGMWTLDLEAQPVADSLTILAGVQIATSLGEARSLVRQLAESVRLQRTTGRSAVAAESG